MKHILRRWHVLAMIAVVLLAICLVAAAKLLATPKYDRIQVGMTPAEVIEVFYPQQKGLVLLPDKWYCDEGDITVAFSSDPAPLGPPSSWVADERRVTGKSIKRRGPLERLAGWY